MLSADKRIPHPELIQRERDRLSGLSPAESQARFLEAAAASERKLVEAAARRAKAAEERVTHVDGGRFDFRFTNINVDDAGPDGRSAKATGWRYGVPFYDRRRGQVKIPTKGE